MTDQAGLDVLLRTVNICVIDDQGERVAETRLPSEVQDIVAHLDDLDPDIASFGLEAGTLAQYLTYGLQSAGFDVVCMEARQVRAALSAMRYKTDKHDARGIAQLLLSGFCTSFSTSSSLWLEIRCCVDRLRSAFHPNIAVRLHFTYTAAIVLLRTAANI